MLHMSQQVVLKLKTLVLDQMGEEVPEISRLIASKESLEGKTNSEIKALAPKLDYGTLILRILATSVKPTDIEDAGKLYTYITSIRNKYKTDKGEWHLEAKDIKELKDCIKKTEGPLMQPMMAGQLQELLTDLELELKEKSKKDK